MAGKHTSGPWLDWTTLEWLYEPKRLLANTEDARLLAAAPDLLSIVERFVALPSGAWHPERHAAEEAELMQEARAAIAKAKGEDGEASNG